MRATAGSASRYLLSGSRSPAPAARTSTPSVFLPSLRQPCTHEPRACEVCFPQRPPSVLSLRALLFRKPEFFLTLPPYVGRVCIVDDDIFRVWANGCKWLGGRIEATRPGKWCAVGRKQPLPVSNALPSILISARTGHHSIQRRAPLRYTLSTCLPNRNSTMVNPTPMGEP